MSLGIQGRRELLQQLDMVVILTMSDFPGQHAVAVAG